jgi:hypothetical protein
MSPIEAQVKAEQCVEKGLEQLERGEKKIASDEAASLAAYARAQTYFTAAATLLDFIRHGDVAGLASRW